MKKLLLTITALTLGLSIIPAHGAERKRMAESDSSPAGAIKKQKVELSKKLGLAIAKNNAQEVIEALDQGANPNTITFIHPTFGILCKDHNPIKYLLTREKQPEKLPNGMLVQDVEAAIIVALVNHGLDVNKPDYSVPLLVSSAYRGNLAITKILIDLGADVNQPIHPKEDRLADGLTVGMTPLMAASVRGEIDTMKLLLANGADPVPFDAQGHDIEYHLNLLRPKRASQISNIYNKKQEILNIIKPYKKSYRDATIQQIGEDYVLKDLAKLIADYAVIEDPELENIHAKKQAANIDESGE